MPHSKLRSNQHTRMRIPLMRIPLVRNPRMRLPARHTIVELTAAAVVALATAAALSTSVNAQTPPAATPPASATTAASPLTATTAGTTAATTAATTGRLSFYADRRDFAVGDIVTILIDDYTITTALKENVSSDTRSRGLSLAARLPTSSKSVGIDTRNDAAQNERGSAKRENRFQNEMSVRVVALGENGMLQLKGTKNINVDKNVQDITLSGWVRAQDISASNMVGIRSYCRRDYWLHLARQSDQTQAGHAQQDSWSVLAVIKFMMKPTAVVGGPLKTACTIVILSALLLPRTGTRAGCKDSRPHHSRGRVTGSPDGLWTRRWS